MPHILFGLLALLFLGGPAMGKNSDFRPCLLAARTTPQVLQNQAAGNAARDAIAASRPGSLIEQNFRVTGGLRRVDVLDGLTAIESKVGRTSLTPAVRQELARDIKLLRSGQVDAVQWQFSPSPTTGLGGRQVLFDPNWINLESLSWNKLKDELRGITASSRCSHDRSFE
jgi:hypothetical protein